MPLRKIDHVNMSHREKIEQYLVRHGFSTMTGTRGHEVQNPKVATFQTTCAVCGTANRSTRIRCRRCDAFIIVKKPTGTDKQQKEYMQEYVDEYDKIIKAPNSNTTHRQIPHESNSRR